VSGSPVAGGNCGLVPGKILQPEKGSFALKRRLFSVEQIVAVPPANGLKETNAS
jgi:hypothetical protein